MTKEETIRDMEMALREALATVRPEAHLDWKSMFGGAGYYADGHMFAAWFGNELALKLAEEDRKELLQVSGAVQSQSPQYIEVPPELIRNPKLLEPWVARSIAYVNAVPQKKRKK